MDNKKPAKVRQIMAIIAIAAIGVFVVAMCICMIMGSTELMMASLFCLIVVPIMIYFLILIYDKTHPEGSISVKDIDKLKDVESLVKEEEK